MADSDGSVIVNVGMDVDDAEKELDRLKKRVIKLQSDLNETSGKKTALEQEFERANEEYKKLWETAYRDEEGNFLPGEIEKLEQLEQHCVFLDEQIKKTRDQEIIDKAALDGAKNAYGEFAAEAEKLHAIEQEQKDEEAQRLFEISENAEVADQKIVDLIEELKELKNRQAELQSAGVGLGFEEFDDNEKRIAEINEELKEYRKNIRLADEEEENLGKTTNSASDGMRKAAGFADKFSNRLKNILAGAFFFNVFSAGIKQLQKYIAGLLQENAQVQASLSQLKASVLTLAQPILKVLIPVLVFLLNLLTRIVAMIANVASKLFGKTLADSANAAKEQYKQTATGAKGATKALNKEGNALDDVKDSAKEAQKSLAGFDEINKLVEKDGQDNPLDDISNGLGGSDTMPDFASLINMQIDSILELFTGIALLAIGAILTFSGADIPLGIGLMIIGALMIYDAVATNWSAIQEALQGPLGAVLAIIGGALLAIGFILVFSGQIPLGIALMVIGAASLATAVAVNWKTISNALQGATGAGLAILSGALLVIGCILAFSGVALPLGIALIAVGATGLAMAVAANWNTISDAMRGPIGTITTIVSSALLVIGAVLLFTGCNIPLGLGLMAAGAIGLAVSLSPYWDNIQKTLQGKIGAITAIISAALLALGVILVFTGVGIPLGLGMILAGAVGLATTVAANWDFILDKLSDAWNNIVSWWNNNVSNFTDPSWWVELGRNMVDGLLNGLGSIFAGLSSWASSIWDSITSSFSQGNAQAAISSAMPSPISRAALPSIPIMDVPALARGAVIPPNREFLAVLGDQATGTNVEAPLSTIQQAVRVELQGQVDAMMAGFEAVVAAIRDKQMDVYIGDGDIGRAAARYQDKMKFIKGGGY